MKRNIAILSALALLLFLLGWFFTQADESTADTGAMSSQENSSSGGPSTGGGDAAEGSASGVSVLRFNGDVRVKSKVDGWQPVKQGQILGSDDEVESGAQSQVTLKVGDNSTVEMMSDARVAVREISDTVQRMGLLNGRVSVNYEEKGARVLQIENEDGTAFARVKEGKFSMMNNGTVVAVATETGAVDLSSGGETITVNAGNSSVAAGGTAPSRPGVISVQTILRLSESACRRQLNNSVRVRGAVEPGTRVYVNNKVAKVTAQGQFVADVTLAPGKTRIVVETEDVVGRRLTRSVSCVIVGPEAAPEREIDFKWGVPKARKAS